MSMAPILADDLSGDGIPDVLLAIPRVENSLSDFGEVYLFEGPIQGSLAPSDALLTLRGAKVGDQFGSSIAAVGDVNGDGFEDLLVGARGDDRGGRNSGAAYLYYGPFEQQNSKLRSDVQFVGELPGDLAGMRVASAGDVNGDGLSDLLISAMWAHGSQEPDVGAVYLVLGGQLSGEVSLSRADAKIAGVKSNDYLGFSLSGVGDVNGDGYDDVLVGAWGADEHSKLGGGAYLYYGPLSGQLSTQQADVKFMPSEQVRGLGFQLAKVGDVNGDGRSEILLSGSQVWGGQDVLFLFHSPLKEELTVLEADLNVDLGGKSVAPLGIQFLVDGSSQVLLASVADENALGVKVHMVPLQLGLARAAVLKGSKSLGFPSTSQVAFTLLPEAAGVEGADGLLTSIGINGEFGVCAFKRWSAPSDGTGSPPQSWSFFEAEARGSW